MTILRPIRNALPESFIHPARMDRHARGFVPYLGVGENLTLCILDRLSNWGIESRTRRDRVAAGLVEQLGIVASNLDQPAGQLSGGNHQKVVAGPALARHPTLLIP